MDRKGILRWGAATLLGLLAVLSIALVYYMIVAVQGNPGNWVTDALELLLNNESAILGPVAALIVALPALVIGTVTGPEGRFTRLGVVYFVLLLVTLLFSLIAGTFLDPTQVALGGENMPNHVDATASRLSTFSSTLLAGMLGLKASGKQRAKGVPQ